MASGGAVESGARIRRGNKTPPAIELIGRFAGIDEIGIADFGGKLRQELRDRLFGITRRVHANDRYILTACRLIDFLEIGPLHHARFANVKEPEYNDFSLRTLQ